MQSLVQSEHQVQSLWALVGTQVGFWHMFEGLFQVHRSLQPKSSFLVHIALWGRDHSVF